MPVYNGENYVAEALNSVLAQTFEDFELIISDNASVDRTQEICRDYAAGDRRISYTRNETNLGAARNFNRVFHLSSSKYFKWMTHDDLCAPEYLQECLQVLDSEPDVILAYPKTTVVDANGKVVAEYEDNLDLRSPRPSQRFRELFQKLQKCNAVFGLMRREVLAKTPLIGPYIGSDICLLAELSLRGKFHEIPKRLFFRRDHPLASSSRKDLAAQQEFYDPATKGKIQFWRWRHHFAYLSAIFRAPMGLQERAILTAFLLRYAIWNRQGLTRELLKGLREAIRRPQ